ncbi:delta-1-pyrroline-5-carboxylate dehydrogenase, mitochondrial-like isoform X2 [Glandiceps talaboti]
MASLSIKNEPMFNFTKDSPERKQVEEALKSIDGQCEEIPVVIGGERIFTGNCRYQVSPYDHQNKIAKYHLADKDLINKAIDNAMSVRAEWERRPLEERTQVFLKAADLLSTKYRPMILATTMKGQGKNIWQAEIDAAAELIDFYRFNAKFALEVVNYKPIDTQESINTMEYRGLEGFVAAVSPFNFTAIGGNLAGAPAMMGNVVLWKPSDTAMLAGWTIYKVLEEAGLPNGVIQFVPADGPVFGDTITSSPHLAAINFTGSVKTFQHLWRQVGENIQRYRTFPRLVGECGGKNYHFVHSSADAESVVNGSIRSAFEYGGQKCSACSRAYIPDSLWPTIKSRLLEEHKKIKFGPADDFSVFLSAVIDDKSFGRIKEYLDYAKGSPNLDVLAGGNYDDSKGYFIEPTIIETKDPKDKIMQEEIFGPVLTVYVYPDKDYKEVLQLVNETSPFALTGSVFALDQKIVDEASQVLRQSAGNFYINDKSTGSVVGQQPFGGARVSGTNDKAGGPHYCLKWVSPMSVKETKVPLTGWTYPHMKE